MTPTIITLDPPKGYRYMLAHEAERLDYASPIVLLHASGLCHGNVIRHGDEDMTVQLRGGAIVTLDLDSPDYWPDDEMRDRRPPMSADGEFVALHEVLATPEDEIEPLLRTGAALAGLAKNDPELATALAEVRRILIDRLKGKAA